MLNLGACNDGLWSDILDRISPDFSDHSLKMGGPPRYPLEEGLIMKSKLTNTSLLALLILALSGMASAADHTVNQVGITFDPAVLTIEPGDTVTWVWSGGSHTVTSGMDLSDPELGMLFDAPLNASNTSYTHTFLDVGEFPYLCRPHAGLNMMGTIIVEYIVPTDNTSMDAVKALYR